MVPEVGLEPTTLAGYGSKPYAYSNSATLAKLISANAVYPASSSEARSVRGHLGKVTHYT